MKTTICIDELDKVTPSNEKLYNAKEGDDIVRTIFKSAINMAVENCIEKDLLDTNDIVSIDFSLHIAINAPLKYSIEIGRNVTKTEE